MKPVILAAAVAAASVVSVQAGAVTVRSIAGPTGVETWLAEEHALPMVAFEISLPAGSAYDPPGRQGLASMAASLLDEGAGDLGSDAFKEALESRAIRLSARADRDYLVITLTSLSESTGEAVRLTALALGHPRFDPAAVERMRAAALARLKQEDQNPARAAVKAWYGAYFGEQAYAHAPDGSVSGISAVTPSDLSDFAAAHFARGGIKVAVAGDIGEAALKRDLQQLFLALPDRNIAAAAKPSDTGKPGLRSIPRSEAAPVAVFGMAGPMRNDPDYIAAYVANEILGGGTFSARLMDQVRDKRGLTYGIETHLDDFRSAGVIVGEVQSDKTKIDTALQVTTDEMARFARDGATAKELSDAKTYLTGSYPLTLDSDAKIARTLGQYQRSGLPADYVAKRNALIGAVTLTRVNEAAKKYFDPSRLLVVIVGTPAAPAKSPLAPQH
ncbi:MAG TPA: pitrilysin family protein [Micropepsaceae bacterium]|nr:pitrilysin family protein [Micropepsaceae bacterium]